jgi:LAO/AO transport system kinase
MSVANNAGASPTGAQFDVERYASAIRDGDRAMLARAITLIESTKPAHQAQSAALLQAINKDTGKAHRIGITGVPGVGKSTTIDQFGINLIEAGHRVAVLAVDPTSSRSGGSILGDKTRMNRLAVSPQAFVRPSPTSGTLGGVARKTRETMALVEAAGFDIVIVETVGVGQSETTVAEMVDTFVVLLLPGGGDELQGIKKGIIELADLIAINKADGENVARAERSASDYRGALSLLTPASENWQPPVLTVSGLTGAGLDELWAQIRSHRDRLTASGEFAERRQGQAVRWMHDMIADKLHTLMLSEPNVSETLARMETGVRSGELAPTAAVGQVIEEFIRSLGTSRHLEIDTAAPSPKAIKS